MSLTSPAIGGAGAATIPRSSRFRRIAWRWSPLLLLAPALALVIVFRILPMAEAIHLAFTKWEGFASPTWIGTRNFEELLHDARFREALEHNLFVLLAVPVWIFFPYWVAWVIHTKIPGWRIFRFAFFIPVVLSPVVIGIYYGIILNTDGAFNALLRAVGLDGVARPWLNEPSLALFIVIAIIIWLTFGVGTLIFLGGLANLDQEQIDAARVDGASNWQVQRHVIFWQLLPVIEFWTVIIIITSFTSIFPLIYALTRGGPGSATFTLDYDIYQEAFVGGQLGYASAIGVAQFALIAVISVVALAILRRRRG